MYPEELVAPMRQELTDIGFKELRSAADVDRFLGDRHGTKLVVINSVCGCAAGGARPGLALAIKHDSRPDALATVFAGNDTEATAKVRAWFGSIPPSSPSMGLFKDGELVHFVPRHAIEGRSPQQVAFDLVEAFDKYCATQPA